MPRWAIGVGALVAACATRAAPEHKAPQSTVELPAPTTSAEAEHPAVSPAVARGSASGSLAECVTELRRASDVPGAPEERALYDQALAAEERGALNEARKAYFELVSKHPASRLIPLAYLAFGELFARDAVADPTKWDLARASYGEVVKYPPPDNVAYAYGLLRLAESQRERGDQEALGLYKKAMDAVQQYPSERCAELVTQRSEEGLVETYVRVGRPERAWTFFRATAGEPRARVLLGDLAGRYKRAGKAAEACAAVRGADPGVSAELARSFCP